MGLNLGELFLSEIETPLPSFRFFVMSVSGYFRAMDAQGEGSGPLHCWIANVAGGSHRTPRAI